jgi:hypothetical protein
MVAIHQGVLVDQAAAAAMEVLQVARAALVEVE